MNLEDLIEAHLNGDNPDIPPQQRAEFEQALAGHRALQHALGETILVPDAAPADRPPPVLGEDYEVERELGRGGMGVVYLVRQKSLGRRVAVKVLRPGEQTFGPLVRRFLEEARHLARLRHPNIVSIHEIGQAGDEPYFTMDYVEGEPLSTLLQRGPLPPTQAVALLKQVVAAIQHAHQQGIIHRDLKPSNVLLDAAGHAFVTDFGLARNLNQSGQLTEAGAILGTPQYMAPEQARGQAEWIGEATDIHALGAILYEMLTGRPPYGAGPALDILVRLVNEEPPAPRRLDRRVPRDLETICLKCLQKDPAKRYPAVSALLEDLRRFEIGEPLLARREGIIARVVRWARRRWKLAAVAAATAVLVLAVVPFLFDTSTEQLMAWADRERAAGKPAEAAQMYLKALEKSRGPRRRDLLERIARCCRDLDDPRAAVDLALRVVEEAPDLSFGKHDYLAAQALLARARAQSPSHYLYTGHQAPHPDLLLAEKRLQLFLDGRAGTPDERREAEQTLTALRAGVAAVDRPEPGPVRVAELPRGTVEELRRLAADESRPWWERGKAALAAAQTLESTGDAAGARTAFRQAYDTIRKVYPLYAGPRYNLDLDVPAARADDPAECRLVRTVLDGLRRLDPEAADPARGGLRFRVEGVTLPASLRLGLAIDLCDPDITAPNAGLPVNLQRVVPLAADQTAWVGVLDGRYRLKVPQVHRQTPLGDDRLAKLLELDLSALPAEVEVHGAPVDLPPIRARLAEEITLLDPGRTAGIDLRKDVFRWKPVPGAASYRLVLYHVYETPTPTHTFVWSPETTAASVCLGTLPPQDQARIRQHLTTGRTAVWQVEAYDAQKRRIGKSLEERPFLIANGLDP
jgi:predicted Ser/Thr protein kinase